MILTEPKALELSDAINKVENKRRRLCESIEAIKEHKRKNKALYRAYYLADEDLGTTIKGFEGDAMIYGCVKHFRDVDTSDIFYKAKKMRTLGDATIQDT